METDLMKQMTRARIVKALLLRVTRKVKGANVKTAGNIDL